MKLSVGRRENKNWVLENWKGSKAGSRAECGTGKCTWPVTEAVFFPEVTLFRICVFKTLFIKGESFPEFCWSCLSSRDHTAGDVLGSGF